jgi:hypothetical protein
MRTSKQTRTVERLILSALLLTALVGIPVSMAEGHRIPHRGQGIRAVTPTPTPPSRAAPPQATRTQIFVRPTRSQVGASQTPVTGTVLRAQPLYSTGGRESRQIGTIRPGELFTIVRDQNNFTWVQFADGRSGFLSRTEVKEVIEVRRGPRMEANCSDCHVRSVQQPLIAGQSLRGLGEVAGHLNQQQPQPPQRPGDLRAPVTRVPTASDEIINVASGRAERLMIEARRQALVCRQPASFLRRRLGSQPICGNRSKGLCYRAVKDALTAAGITRSNLPGNSAKDAHQRGYLRQAGMRDIMANLRSRHGNNLQAIAQNAPPGAVLVYEGGSHGHGHIEIKSGQNEYCSDFCSTRPVNTYLRRRLIGVYVP